MFFNTTHTVAVCFQAVAFVLCGGAVLKGRVADMREQLHALLPAGEDDEEQEEEEAFPDYETQDDVVVEEKEGGVSDSESDSPTIQLDCDFDSMNVGDCVEVFWSGEDTWYEGEIIEIDPEDRTFQVLYVSDNQKLWHKDTEYKCRFAC